MPRTLVLATAMIWLGTCPAMAQQSPLTSGASAPVSRDIPFIGRPRLSRISIDRDYAMRLTSLREAMLKQRVADGGQLSQANVERFQSKLDRINEDRARELRLNAGMSGDRRPRSG